MAEVVYYWRQALDCARRATESSEQEERCLLLEMSEAWKKLAFVEADVAKGVTAEWTLHTLN
jgi:hypothetical protein